MYIIKPEIFTQKMNVLIYGDPGSGKTHLAGTAQDHPGMANVHFFNIDGGLLTLAHRGDIRASDITSLEGLEAEMWKIAQGHPDYAGIQTIVIDNITELQTLSLEEIVRQELKGLRGKKEGASIDEIYQDDYGKSTKQMARILRGFRDLPLNKIYIAHRKDKMRRNTSIIESTLPSLTEKLGTAVAGYMDFVWYLYQGTEEEGEGDNIVQTTHRYLLTQSFEAFFAKTRGQAFASALGPFIKDPNMAEIYEIFLQAHGLKDRAEAQKEEA